MSVERIQLLHEDYIRLTERFKALWTFHQFLRGIYKTFFSSEPGYAIDFNTLYEEVKGVATAIQGTLADSAADRIREISGRLEGIARQLRDVDRKVSPSFVRRFFDRVRPQDEKIALYLLRFYFSQSDVDEDVVDKVDFLATVAATGRPEPDAATSRPRPAIQRLFEAVTSSSVWPRIESGIAPSIVRAFDELASDMAQAQEFEQLLTDRLLNNARTMKRRVASGLSNPEILTAVAWCNLTTRAVFHRLYEREERRLDEATGRITDLERELTRGGEDPASAEEFQRFRESRIRFDRQAMDRNLRAQHVVELKRAIGEVLDKFDVSGLEAEDIDEALELVEEVDSVSEDEAFWGPCLQALRESLEAEGKPPADSDVASRIGVGQAQRGSQGSTNPTQAPDPDGNLLRAEALRRKADQERVEIRAAASGESSPELLRSARATLLHAPALDSVLEKGSAEPRPLEEDRTRARTRHRLRRAISDLWLALDEAGAAPRLE